MKRARFTDEQIIGMLKEQESDPVLVDWPASVIVNLDELGGPQIVGSTREAAFLLMQFWPTRRGHAFGEALRLCAEALDAHVDPKVARRAFLKAAEEAGIIVRLH